MRSRGIGAVLLTAWTLGAAAGQGPVFESGTELVRVTVSVVDRDGQPVSGLTARDFAVEEDGVPQQIRTFVRGDDPAPDLPTHLGLLFDTSGSMGDDIELSRTAAIRFLNGLPEAADMTLVDFDSEVRVTRFGQADFPRLVERIRQRRPRGLTALYDALGVYLDGASSNEGRTVLVVYTDGGDTQSALSYRDTLALVRTSDVTIYVVGFLSRQSGVGRLQQRAMLSQLAEASGGLAYFPGGLRDVDQAYAQILAQVRGQYTLGYVSTNTAADGQWREVGLRLTRPDLSRVRLLARDGYFARLDPVAVP
ncbi:MAG: VWA domain-containing protein [Acidobacteria bacterium]|nr:VWA domain-containing protein [Acidobacteriota bacterium]